ncbi:hypothetical protein [Acinetobacter ihumii]|uniref:hypothetical protein n=1 Tax=Acinetobacter ihumii TaxID=2483802 RepID=UPI001D1924F9|nr:hypothetical protein [Acinetobacter ihumii]
MGEEKPQNKINYTVEFGATFNLYYSERYSSKTLDKIDDFIEHYEKFGLKDWKGKISPSDRVPDTYPNQQNLIAKAKKYNLWHVHIGEPKWQRPLHDQYLVSEWVLHFQKINNYHIKLLELSWHNPMELPSDEMINEE